MITKTWFRLAHKIRNNKWLSDRGLKRIEQKVREFEIRKYQSERRNALGF